MLEAAKGFPPLLQLAHLPDPGIPLTIIGEPV